jgi:hypothetical protein
MIARRWIAVALLGGSLFAFAHKTEGSCLRLLQVRQARSLAETPKKYKVTLSKSDQGHNRTVYIDATDSSEARQTAKDQNPGWQVEDVSQVK